MQTLIIVIHLMIVLAMIGFVLLQKSEGGGLGMGSSGGGFLSSRGTANVLTRTTAYLAAAFFGTSLVLSILAGMHRNPGSIVRPTTDGPTVPAPAPGAPSAPLSGGTGGLFDQMQKQEQAPPAPPSGPQVPQSQ
jgi:preprotein translocase subunit SecG